MNAYDLSPLFRHSVGFDRLKNALESASRLEDSGHPAYDIVNTGENSYRITLVVPGFSEKDIEIESRENVLTVKANAPNNDGNVSYLHRGITPRDFTRSFQLADHVSVTMARLENGLLHIGLLKEVPEAMQPRRIKIDTPDVVDGNVVDGNVVDGEVVE